MNIRMPPPLTSVNKTGRGGLSLLRVDDASRIKPSACVYRPEPTAISRLAAILLGMFFLGVSQPGLVGQTPAFSTVPAETSESGMDFVIVVDTSGSMNADLEGNSPRTQKDKFTPPSRIDYLVDRLKEYAGKLANAARYSRIRLRLISFNTGIKTNEEFLLSDPESVGRLMRTIESLRKEPNPRADTHLWEALRQALLYARNYVAEDPDVTVCLYVLTDGEQDNQESNREMDISFAKVLNGFPELNGESLYGSLVLLGRGDGFFTEEFVAGLRDEASGRFDVELSEDFDLLFPAVLMRGAERVTVGEAMLIVENSGQRFARIEWTINGENVGSEPNLRFVPQEIGRYVISFRGIDDRGRRARAKTVVNVRQAEVVPKPIVKVDGIAISDAGRVDLGSQLDLSHQSTGPIESVVWIVNEEQLEADTLRRVIDRPGTYSIQLRVISKLDAGGEKQKAESRPIIIEVAAPRAETRAEVKVEGRPITEKKRIYPKESVSLRLVSNMPVQDVLWKVKSEDYNLEIESEEANFRIPAAGSFVVSVEYFHPSETERISLGQIASFEVSARPPYLMIAGVIGGIGTLWLASLWLLTRNGYKAWTWEVSGKNSKDVHSYKGGLKWDAIHKTGSVAATKLFSNFSSDLCWADHRYRNSLLRLRAGSNPQLSFDADSDAHDCFQTREYARTPLETKATLKLGENSYEITLKHGKVHAKTDLLLLTAITVAALGGILYALTIFF
jgi:hypothetical protein